MYGIQFSGSGGPSKYRQLVDQLRSLIIRGELAGGTRLASTRALAQALGLARGIVVEAVDQLSMEGYLETLRGSGTFVVNHVAWPSGTGAPDPGGALVKEPGTSRPLLSFLPGMPDPTLFPRRAWLKCYHQALEYASDGDLGYNRASGRTDLRQALVDHLLQTKGIRAGVDQVVVTAGSAQALALVATLFRSQPVALEDPQAPFLRRIFDETGGPVIDVPVDWQGIIPQALPPGPLGLIYTTPAHQFPLGGTLPADRRAALFQRAQASGAFIIEDDFDSEYRLFHHPVPPLQVSDPDRVIYVGSFSKIFTPAIRMGFLVLPRDLVARVKLFKSRWDQWNEGLQQKAMGLFLAQGHMQRHLRRCLTVYRQKNQELCRLVSSHLGGLWTVASATTGTHLILKMDQAHPGPRSASQVSDRLRARGIQAEAVSPYCRKNTHFDDCLVVGFGNRRGEDFEKLVGALKEIGVPTDPLEKEKT